MKAPGWQEYGKLSYAGAGSYTQIDALPALCTTWRKRPLSSKPQVKQLKTGPVSSVGRASPW